MQRGSPVRHGVCLLNAQEALVQQAVHSRHAGHHPPPPPPIPHSELCLPTHNALRAPPPTISPCRPPTPSLGPTPPPPRRAARVPACFIWRLGRCVGCCTGCAQQQRPAGGAAAAPGTVRHAWVQVHQAYAHACVRLKPGSFTAPAPCLLPPQLSPRHPPCPHLRRSFKRLDVLLLNAGIGESEDFLRAGAGLSWCARIGSRYR